MDSTLPAVAEELLKEIKKAFRETSHVPDDLLLGLKFIFGPSAVPALDLVDQRSVTRVMSPSGRTAYQANSTPATVPATSARVLLLVLRYCRRARAFCANIYLPSTSVRPWEPARNSLSLRSSSQASYWLRKRMKDEGFGSHVDVLSVDVLFLAV
ncbi:PREDICTED: zinc finger SWIM domain-containing protein 7 isoform X1 [Nipponia nippon]|uniref:zinc finger SWIM domain-containing protein 7 isoform X1 n=1 Tax=Nipponia nippon TaxID=128390 RepID=UPI000510A4B2|nr:PREDICTED: zinc finger SWIM domain-containing protein 7 isoform X1 [Nipponia nippon]